MTGWSIGSGTDSDYATIKYHTGGNELWVRRYNGQVNGLDFAYSVAVDSSGNIYVTGESDGSGMGRDYATVKYDTHGNELWVRRYNGPGSGDDVANALAVDASGNVYVTGESEGLGTGSDYATVKYDTNGTELWVARYNSPGNDSDFVRDIAIDVSGKVYVTGESIGVGTGSDYATVQYDTDGHEVWVTRYDGPDSGNDQSRAIAVDASGKVYVTGGSYDSATRDDYATLKYGEGLPAGWSMISLPVDPTDKRLNTLFPEAVVVYGYQKGAGYMRVQAEEELDVGVGYWILLNKPQPYITKGTEIPEYTIPVSDGWYMIGGCSMPADKMVTSGKIDVVYGYTQGVGYQRVSGSHPLERGKGYWILFSNTSEGAEFTASTSASE